MDTLLTLDKLAEGLTCWLNYEAVCRRGAYFNEAYLRYALLQCLWPSFQNNILVEQPHPVLGNNFSVDFAVVEGDSRWGLAVETKWLGESLARRSRSFE